MSSDRPPVGERDDASGTLRRRTLLGGLLGLTSVSGGCVQRVQNIVNRDTQRSLSLKIKTTPADADRQAIAIGRTLAEHLAEVGIDSTVVPMAKSQLYRDVLINHNFDLYVAQCPSYDDPDFLRPLLHSRFAEDLGWQNPFGFADLNVDELLAKQRGTSGRRRTNVVSQLQRDVVRRQPFTTVVFPDVIQAVRPDRYSGWQQFKPDSPLSYLQLQPRNPVRMPATSGAGERGRRLRVTTTDGRVTENINPLMVEFRTGGTFTDLIYDRIAYRHAGSIRPWLAASWTWETDPSSERQVMTVDLRENARWHDGRPVTATDVAFTYRFLRDTSLGKQDVPIPAPRFHGRVSLVEGVDVIDDHTVRIEFTPCHRTVAKRALIAPVLPRRKWEPKATEPHIAGLDLSDGVTEALVWNNRNPVGSGPLRFHSSASGEQLVLARFDDHFLNDGPNPAISDQFGDGVPFEQLDVRVVSSSAVAVSLLAADRADVTATHVDTNVVPRIGRHDVLRLQSTPSRSFYHVGFNTRRSPLSNSRFRRTIARLVDREQITDDVFDGYATPATSPLGGSRWEAPSLKWRGDSPTLPFFGDEGRLDVEQARAAFREAGFRIDDTGESTSR